MGEIAYRSVVRLTERQGSDRTVVMPVGERVRFGTHGPVAQYYGRDPQEITPCSTTLDYVVAAALG